MITGKTLIGWGFKPGQWFSYALTVANEMHQQDRSDDDIRAAMQRMQDRQPPEIAYRTNAIPFGQFIEPETDDEIENTNAVIQTMDALMRTPTIVKGAVMPDACPAGTIPVGGVVATDNAIHPGFHSADICCSMAISVFKRRDDVAKVLDAAMQATHFGPGGRNVIAWHHGELNRLLNGFKDNPFLAGLEDYGIKQFMTQGDGNHFLFVGELQSTGELAIVTHHGSRGLGAQLYKRGKRAAERHTRIVSPRTPAANAWIKADSYDGEDYWDALQMVRQWTKLNHFAIHDDIGLRLGNRVVRRFWNEHNFVFRRSDGLFYHAKGATPSFSGFAEDDSGLTLIPMNMAQPILIASHANNEDALGFAPHGAGRNYSRSTHMRRLGEVDQAAVVESETAGLDVRFYTGRPDLSELPSAYKRADEVHRQIQKFNLATIEDMVLPLGSIMAGESHYVRHRKSPQS